MSCIELVYSLLVCLTLCLFNCLYVQLFFLHICVQIMFSLFELLLATSTVIQNDCCDTVVSGQLMKGLLSKKILSGFKVFEWSFSLQRSSIVHHFLKPVRSILLISSLKRNITQCLAKTVSESFSNLQVLLGAAHSKYCVITKDSPFSGSHSRGFHCNQPKFLARSPQQCWAI